MQELLPKLIGVLGAVFLFGFAILVHELGHFLVAKWCGVGVKKFAIGFGPRIFWFVRGGTEYSLRWIPVGGFVALKGMIEGLDEEEHPEKDEGGRNKDEGRGGPGERQGDRSDDAGEEEKTKGAAGGASASSSLTEDLDALRNKPPLVRIAVFVAGVTCNYLTAIAFVAALLVYGTREEIDLPNQIEEVPEGYALYQLGWRSGDRIVAVSARPVSSLGPVLDTLSPELISPKGESLKTWQEVKAAIGRQVAPGPRFRTWAYLKRKLWPQKEERPIGDLVMTVERDGQILLLPFPADLWTDPEEMERFSPPLPPYVEQIVPGSPAHRTRLVRDNYKPGEVIRPYPTWGEMKAMPLAPEDRIVALNQKPVATWLEMTKILRAYPGGPVTLTVERRKGAEKRLLLLTTILERDAERPERGQLGIYSHRPLKARRTGIGLADALLRAPMLTLEKTDIIVAETVRLLATLPKRELRRNLGGPVAIVVMAYKTAQRGLGHYMWLFVYISIILVIVNLLPIPVLDGGYVLITVVEAVIGRPIPAKYLAPVLMTFMILLLCLIVLLLYNDFMNLVYKF